MISSAFLICQVSGLGKLNCLLNVLWMQNRGLALARSPRGQWQYRLAKGAAVAQKSQKKGRDIVGIFRVSVCHPSRQQRFRERECWRFDEGAGGVLTPFLNPRSVILFL